MTDSRATSTQGRSAGDTVAYIIVMGLVLLGVRSCGADEAHPATTPLRSAFARACNPNYTGCLPMAFDVDCAEVLGSVLVIGTDVYRLDADFDGIGCE